MGPRKADPYAFCSPSRASFSRGVDFLVQLPRPLGSRVIPVDSSKKTPTSSTEGEPVPAEFTPVLYAELRRLAAHYLRRERPYHTLQTTALVHEAYLRLITQKEVHWENKAQFLGIAARLMRRILVDYSRVQHAAKRGKGVTRVFLNEANLVSKERTPDVLVVDAALSKLAQIDHEQARLVELRFFGGLTIEEAAGVLGTSTATVKRSWNVAKAWLARELSTETDRND